MKEFQGQKRKFPLLYGEDPEHSGRKMVNEINSQGDAPQN